MKKARGLSRIHIPSFVLSPQLAQTLRFTGHMAGSDASQAERSMPWAGLTRRPHRTKFKELRPCERCENCVAQCLRGQLRGTSRKVKRHSQKRDNFLFPHPRQRDRVHILTVGSNKRSGLVCIRPRRENGILTDQWQRFEAAQGLLLPAQATGVPT